jgi:hypothetical protein
MVIATSASWACTDRRELGGQILQAGGDNHEVAVIKLVISMDPVATGNPSSSAVAEL